MTQPEHDEALVEQALRSIATRLNLRVADVEFVQHHIAAIRNTDAARIKALEAELEAHKRAIKLAFMAGEERGRYNAGVSTAPLLTEPNSIPAGCNCGEVCMAPIMMGRQQPCRRATLRSSPDD